MIEKPPYGSPCNSCGLCCEFSPCVMSRAVFKKTVGPCPALGRDEDGASWCGLVVDPRKFAPTRTAKHGAGHMREAALVMIGSGVGCDAALVSEEPVDLAQRARMQAVSAAVPDETVMAAMRAWGIRVNVAKAAALSMARVA